MSFFENIRLNRLLLFLFYQQMLYVLIPFNLFQVLSENNKELTHIIENQPSTFSTKFNIFTL